MLIHRSSLLARMADADARCIVLIAPAGYGKTTLAEAYLDSQANAFTCDCRDVDRDDGDFARRIIGIFAERYPALRSSLTETLGAATLDDGHTQVRLAHSVWSSIDEPFVMFFENAEQLRDRPRCMGLLLDLVRRRSLNARTLIASRTPLPFARSRLGPPNEVLTLDGNDLRFTKDETKMAFAGTRASPEQIDEVVALTHGWPFAVLLMVRFAKMGELSDALKRVSRSGVQELYEYLLDEVIAGLEPREYETLSTIAALGTARVDELSMTLNADDVAQRVRAVQAALPLVDEVHRGVFRVHPLVQATIEAHDAKLCGELRAKAARRNEDEGKYVRAAQLFLRLADEANAARMLDAAAAGYEITMPSIDFVTVLHALHLNDVVRYPNLWVRTLPFMRAPVTNLDDLYREGNVLYRSSSEAGALDDKTKVGAALVVIGVQLGKLAEAEAITGELESDTADLPVSHLRRITATLARTFLLSNRFRISEALQSYEQIRGFVDDPVVKSVLVLQLEAAPARLTGEYERQCEAIDRAIAFAKKSGQPVRVAQVLTEAVWGAWLQNDEERLEALLTALDESYLSEQMRPFAKIAAIFRGAPITAAPPLSPEWKSRLHVVAAFNAATVEKARRLLRTAVVIAESTGNPFAILNTKIALVTISPKDRAASLREALRIAVDIGVPEVAASVRTLQAGKSRPKIFATVVERFARRFAESVPAPYVAFNMLTGAMVRDSTTIELTEQSRALVAALSSSGGRLSRRELCDLLWPDLDPNDAANALKASVHRLRLQVGDSSCIVWHNGGYSLDIGQAVNLDEVDRFLMELPLQEELPDAKRARLQFLHRSFDGTSRPLSLRNCEWFAPIERRIKALETKIALRLGSDALARDEASYALALAEKLKKHDPCNEAARELAVRAYAVSGKALEVVAEAEEYRRVLKSELDAEPSASFEALVESLRETSRKAALRRRGPGR